MPRIIQVMPNVTDPEMVKSKVKDNNLYDNDIQEDILNKKTEKTAEETSSENNSKINYTLIIIFACIVLILVLIIIWIVYKNNDNTQEENEIRRVLKPHPRNYIAQSPKMPPGFVFRPPKIQNLETVYEQPKQEEEKQEEEKQEEEKQEEKQEDLNDVNDILQITEKILNTDSSLNENDKEILREVASNEYDILNEESE